MLYEASGISKAFSNNIIIDDFNISLEMGDFVAIAGKRGSGLTTVSQILVGLLKPSTGEIYFEDQLVGGASSVRGLTKLRRKNIGYVSTEPVLIPNMTVYDNLIMGLSHTFMSSKNKQKKAKEVLKTLGLKGLGRYFPKELNLVEKQKVCIGRAMMTDPDIIVLDEPTDIFESYDAEQILEILEILNSAGYTLVVSTHSKRVAARTRKIVPVSSDMDVSTWKYIGYDIPPVPQAPQKENVEEAYLRGEEVEYLDEEVEGSSLNEEYASPSLENEAEPDTDFGEEAAPIDSDLENEILNTNFDFLGDKVDAEDASEDYDDGYDDLDDGEYADDYEDDYADEPDDGDYDDYEPEEEFEEDYIDEPLDEEELDELEEAFDNALSEEEISEGDSIEDFKVDLSDILK